MSQNNNNVNNNSNNADIIAAQRQILAGLDAKRKALEMEAEAIVSELTAAPPPASSGGSGEPMGIDTPLVDAEGYPRSDIDVYRARTLRGRLAVIRTDHKELMVTIERGLQQLSILTNAKKDQEEEAERAARLNPKPKPKFDPVTQKWVVMNWDGSVAGVEGGEKRSFHNLEQESVTTTTANNNNNNMEINDNTDNTTSSLYPFAKINSVVEESPAARAGLQEGDAIEQFGTINYTNHRNLMAIAELVQLAAANQEGIVISVVRKVGATGDETRKQLTLHPRPWSGRGLLGCHVVPAYT